MNGIYASLRDIEWLHTLWDSVDDDSKYRIVTLAMQASSMNSERYDTNILSSAEATILKLSLIEGLGKKKIADIKSITAKSAEKIKKDLLSKCVSTEQKQCTIAAIDGEMTDRSFETYFQPIGKKPDIRLRTEDELKKEKGLNWHPFMESSLVKDAGYFPFVRSGLSFWRLGEMISKGTVLPHIVGERKFTALYGGSGSDVSVLETAHRLIMEGKIDKADYIFTDIDKDWIGKLVEVLNALKNEGFYDSVDVGEKVMFEGSAPEKEISETKITVTFLGRKIDILFAINRSGENYYRPEQLEAADILISHDVEISHPLFKRDDDDGWRPLDMGRAKFLSTYMMDRNRLSEERRGRQVLVMENLGEPQRDRSLTSGSFMDMSLLKRDLIYAPYGHRTYSKAGGESGLPFYRSAMVVAADQPLFDTLNAEETGVLIDFFHLAESGFKENIISVPDVETDESGGATSQPTAKILHDGTIIDENDIGRIYKILVTVLDIAKKLKSEMKAQSTVLTLMSIKFLQQMQESEANRVLKRLEIERFDLASKIFRDLVELNDHPVTREKFRWNGMVPPAGSGPSEFLYRYDEEKNYFIGPDLDNIILHYGKYNPPVFGIRNKRAEHVDEYIFWILQPEYQLDPSRQSVPIDSNTGKAIAPSAG